MSVLNFLKKLRFLIPFERYWPCDFCGREYDDKWEFVMHHCCDEREQQRLATKERLR